MRHSLKYIGLVILVLLFLAASCKTGRKEGNQDPVKVTTLRGPAGISMVHMMDSSTQLDGRQVHYQIKNEPMQVRPLLFQEKTDFAVVPTNMAAILYNKGVNYQLAAIPVWGTLYLFGSDPQIQGWSDLKGKKIHLMARGMTPDVMFRLLLKENGIDPQKEVSLDYSFPTHIELANAVASGKASLAVISEPMISMVMHKNPKVQPLISLNEAWEAYADSEIPQTALLVHKPLAQSNPSLVKDFLKAYRRSIQWINHHPRQGGQRVVHYNILNNADVASQSIPRCNLHFEAAYPIRGQVNDYLKTFYRMNPDIVGGKIPDENFFFQK